MSFFVKILCEDPGNYVDLLLHPLHVSVLVVVHELQHVIQVSRRKSSHTENKDRPVGQAVGGLKRLRIMIFVSKTENGFNLSGFAVRDCRSSRSNRFTFIG